MTPTAPLKPADGRSLGLHLLFIVAVSAAGIWQGTNNLPGAWYQALEKPWFTPLNWMFGPVWTVLYILIGIVGARMALHGDTAGRMLWVVQMVANLAWSPVFFGQQNPTLALPVIGLMWVSILAFIAVEWRRDRVSAWLFVPYALWVTVASGVNLGVVLMN